ncbi:MAG: hypothetical protein AAF577_15505 [Pseudomonadota bacterium]
MADAVETTLDSGTPANDPGPPDLVHRRTARPAVARDTTSSPAAHAAAGSFAHHEFGTFSEAEIARARSAGMLCDPEARRMLDVYLHEMAGAAAPDLCAQLRADLLLAQGRADEAHATTLARALLLYLTEHRASDSVPCD